MGRRRTPDGPPLQAPVDGDSAMRLAEERRKDVEAPKPEPVPQAPSLRSFSEEEIERPRKLDYTGRPWEDNPRHKTQALLNRIPALTSNEWANGYVKERLALGEWRELSRYLAETVLPALDPSSEQPMGTREDHLRAKEALHIAENLNEGDAH